MSAAHARPLSALDRRILDLLADGQPRMSIEVLETLFAGEDYAQRRYAASQVQGALTGLRDLGLVQRLIFGIRLPVGTYRYEEKFVPADAVVPVCHNCFRDYWGAEAVPPQVTGRPVQLCSFPGCRKRTNDAAYVLRAEFEVHHQGGNG